MKEESGNFICPKCGHKLFGSSDIVNLEKWISRENNGVKNLYSMEKIVMIIHY